MSDKDFELKTLIIGDVVIVTAVKKSADIYKQRKERLGIPRRVFRHCGKCLAYYPSKKVHKCDPLEIKMKKVLTNKMQ